VLSLAVALALAVTSAAASARPRVATLAGIAAACAAKLDVSGFGSVTLATSLRVSGETATLRVPCTIHLTHGAALTIENSTLTTSKLIVSDDSPSTSGSRLVLRNTTLTGTRASGLLVQMQHAADVITVDGSTISYPLSVYLLIASTDDSGAGGMIEASHDAISSNGPHSEGIHLIADGTGRFSFLTLRTNAAQDDHLAVLYARQCSARSVTGAAIRC